MISSLCLQGTSYTGYNNACPEVRMWLCCVPGDHSMWLPCPVSIVSEGAVNGQVMCGSPDPLFSTVMPSEKADRGPFIRKS